VAGGSVPVGARGESNGDLNAASADALLGVPLAAPCVAVDVAVGVDVRVISGSTLERPDGVGVARLSVERPHADRNAASAVALALCRKRRRVRDLLSVDTSPILPDTWTSVNHALATVGLR
jgi:hypothetical protein